LIIFASYLYWMSYTDSSTFDPLKIQLANVLFNSLVMNFVLMNLQSINSISWWLIMFKSLNVMFLKVMWLPLFFKSNKSIGRMIMGPSLSLLFSSTTSKYNVVLFPSIIVFSWTPSIEMDLFRAICVSCSEFRQYVFSSSLIILSSLLSIISLILSFNVSFSWADTIPINKNKIIENKAIFKNLFLIKSPSKYNIYLSL